MTERTARLIALTGPPGCGKTTLVKKVCKVLREKNVNFNGFFTEEVRYERERIGFNVVLINGEKTPLARLQSGNCKGPMVGKYVVDVKSFELCVLPVLLSEEKNSVLILDEIGKMELLSEKFKEIVHEFINSERVILATVPVMTSRPISLVEMIKEHPNSHLITVDKGNRNDLVVKITDLIIKAAKIEGTTYV